MELLEKRTIVHSIDKLRTPNMVATVPLVSGTVDSHKKPNVTIAIGASTEVIAGEGMILSCCKATAMTLRCRSTPRNPGTCPLHKTCLMPGNSTPVPPGPA